MRETKNFDDPLVPLGEGKWQRASLVSANELERVVAFLQKEDKPNDAYHEYNQRVIDGAKKQLAIKKGV